ncbi:MAG: ABC transporter ATP-binding protein [Magnetococcales bacterium]|nr:ABC transporter ATP-binding protein [Magnetococcales bacterium]
MTPTGTPAAHAVPANPPLLQLERVTAAYGPVIALKGVTLHIRAGEIVTLIGANGAGKSTLLMTIFAAPPLREGRILFDGQDLAGLPTHRIARLGVAQVPEGRRIFPAMTVEENLAMGEAPGQPADAALWEQIWDHFPILRERRRQRAGALSGGEQQMLAIGRALISRPRLLLLDEPSLGLAPLATQRIFAIIDRIAREGATIFLVEQNARQALRLAHRGYVLVNGEIRLSGTGGELLDDPEVQACYLGG